MDSKIMMAMAVVAVGAGIGGSLLAFNDGGNETFAAAQPTLFSSFDELPSLEAGNANPTNAVSSHNGKAITGNSGGGSDCSTVSVNGKDVRVGPGC